MIKIGNTERIYFNDASGIGGITAMTATSVNASGAASGDTDGTLVEETTGKVFYLPITAVVAGNKEVIFSFTDVYGRTTKHRVGYTVSARLVDDISVGTGTGAYTVVLHLHDADDNAVAGATLSVHNFANDDGALLGSGVTNASGNLTLNLDASPTAEPYTVRGIKSGYVIANQNITVTASATFIIESTALVITPPANPSLCRLALYPITLGGADINSLIISITTTDNLTEATDDSGILINHLEGEFIQDISDPSMYYFDAIRKADVTISCDNLFDTDKYITVPDESTKILTKDFLNNVV